MVVLTTGGLQLEAALRDVVHPDTQFSNKIYVPKYVCLKITILKLIYTSCRWDDHMALLEEIEHTSPDAHAGIKKKIWDKVRCEEQNGWF